MIDIGANLVDDMYSGVYHGSKKHRADLTDVLARARKSGILHMIVTCGSLDEYDAASVLMDQWPLLSCTIGYHPTRSSELFDDNIQPKQAATKLRNLISQDNLPTFVRAYGELGLDYDRLHFANKDIQKAAFMFQLDIFYKYPRLPLFLHCRNAGDDFLEILSNYKQIEPRLTGVVHSFDGDATLCEKILSLGFDIGINGCSLKTTENLAVVANIPLERMHLETDCPWCEIKPTHASYQTLSKSTLDFFKNTVKSSAYDAKSHADSNICSCFIKGRTEPAHLNAVAEVVASITAHPFNAQLSLQEKSAIVRRITAQNSIRLFGLGSFICLPPTDTQM